MHDARRRGAHRVPTRFAAIILSLALGLTFLIGDTQASAVDGPVDAVYVARGYEFADSLAGSVLAAMTGKPVLLVPGGGSDDIPAPTAAELKRLKPGKIIIFGGPEAISRDVEKQLREFATTGKTERIEGADRFGTAAQIAQALPSKVNDSDLLDGMDSSNFLTKAGLQGELTGQNVTVPNAELLDGFGADAFVPSEFLKPFFVQLEIGTLVPIGEHGPLTVAAECRDDGNGNPVFRFSVRSSVDGAMSTRTGVPFGPADGWVPISHQGSASSGDYYNHIDSGSAIVEQDGIAYIASIDAETSGWGRDILGQPCTLHGLLNRHTAATGLTPGAEPVPAPDPGGAEAASAPDDGTKPEPNSRG